VDDVIPISRESRPEIIGLKERDGFCFIAAAAGSSDQGNIAVFTPVQCFFHSRLVHFIE
jgi:hypothetical protein